MAKKPKITGFWYGDYPHTIWIEAYNLKYPVGTETRIIEYKRRLYQHTITYQNHTGKSTGHYDLIFDSCEPMDDIPF